MMKSTNYSAIGDDAVVQMSQLAGAHVGKIRHDETTTASPLEARERIRRHLIRI